MTAKTVAMIMIILYNVRMCQSNKYDNYSLFSTVPTTADHLKFLQNLRIQKYINMRFWKPPTKLFRDVQCIVSPADKALFIERTNHFNLKTDTNSRNVGKLFDRQYIKQYRADHTDSYTWNYYHSLEDIYQWLEDMAAQNPDVGLMSIGISAEGRNIYAICPRKPRNKKKVIVEGGIHGNEWISVEFVTYLLKNLIPDEYSSNWQLQELSNNYDWYLIPVVNPDGYVYSQTEDRLWSKNRRVTDIGTGVDLNRNFDYSFGKYATSKNPDDDNYCGSQPFSEPESKVLADFIREKSKNLGYYFSIQAYGQKLIIPYADRVNHLENYAEMESVGQMASLKISRMYGTKYSVGTTFDTLGMRMSGNSASWVKKKFGVRYVFTFLLRDNGSYGYALPPYQILPTCEETVVGLTELMTAQTNRVKLNYRMNRAQKLEAVIFNLFCTGFVILLLK